MGIIDEAIWNIPVHLMLGTLGQCVKYEGNHFLKGQGYKSVENMLPAKYRDKASVYVYLQVIC